MLYFASACMCVPIHFGFVLFTLGPLSFAELKTDASPKLLFLNLSSFVARVQVMHSHDDITQKC